MDIQKRKIACSWQHCSAWVETQVDGSLLIERYDYSGMRGGDESTFWKLPPDAFLDLLKLDGARKSLESDNLSLEYLIQLIEGHDISHQKWLDPMV